MLYTASEALWIHGAKASDVLPREETLVLAPGYGRCLPSLPDRTRQ